MASSPATIRAPISKRRGAGPKGEVPRVSDSQWQALNFLGKLAEELCFEMSFAPGDIQFVNNHVIYHARSAFEDDEEGHDRLLLRRGCRCRTAAPSRSGSAP